MDRARAASLIEGLFRDGGASILSEAELPPSWATALRTVPPGALSLPPAPAADGTSEPDDALAERLLTRIRDVWVQQRRLRPAIAATKALLRRRMARQGKDHPDSLLELGALGALADRAGRVDEARKALEEAWQGLRSIGGGRDLRLAVVAANLGTHYLNQGLVERAERAFEQAWKIRAEAAPASTGPLALQLAELRLAREDVQGALPYLEDAWERLSAQRGAADPLAVSAGRKLIKTLQRAGRPIDILPVLNALYDAAVERGDPEHKAAAAFEMGVGLRAVNLGEEAYRFLEEAIRWTRQAGDPHPKLPERLTVWAEVIIHERLRPYEGEGLLKEALEAERLLYGDDSPEVAIRYATLGHLCAQLGRTDEAMGWLEPAARLLRSTYGDDHRQTRLAVEMLCELLLGEAQKAFARRDRRLGSAYRDHLVEVGAAVLGPNHRIVRAARALGG